MKTTEQSNPQFTPMLALVDAIPVLFFGIAAIMLMVFLYLVPLRHFDSEEI